MFIELPDNIMRKIYGTIYLKIVLLIILGIVF